VISRDPKYLTGMILSTIYLDVLCQGVTMI
jgi:hypothetical protein